MAPALDAGTASSLRRFSLLCGVGVCALGASVAIGWSFELAPLKRVAPGWVTMKGNTALGFVLAGLALVCLLWLSRSAGPGSTEGGALARRLLPLVLGLPIFVAAVGYAAYGIGLVSPPFAVAAGAVIGSLVLGAVAWWTARAIDERELRLERQRHWFSTTLSSIGDGVVAVDLEDRVRFLNREASQLLQVTAAEARGRPLSELFHAVDEKARTRVEAPTRRVLREGRAVGLEQPTLLIRPDGSEIAIDDTAAPISTRDEGMLGAVLVFRDVGEARARQKELERSRTLLAKRARELEEQDQRKDEFMAVLGHELRNPLGALANGVELIEADAELSWIRSMMRRQVRQLSALIDDLLDLARISRGKLRLRREVQALAPIVRSAIESAEAGTEASGRKLELDVEDDELSAEVDEIRFAQIVSNLVGNAIKFTAEDGRIRVGLRREGERVTLVVADDGVGMEPELLERCFDPFTQGKPGGNGLGIGLALVSQLVELQEGSIHAHSEGPGRGSEFRVCFPFRPVRDADPAPAPPGPAASLDGVRVLVVEDNADLASSLAKLLEMKGCTVATAASGKEGLERARAWGPDAILLDFGLPDVEGWEVAASLRDDAELASVPRIAMSGLGRTQARRMARPGDFHAHLVKPIETDELIDLLSELTGTPRRGSSE